MIKFIDANIFIERWTNARAFEFTNSLNSEEHCTSVLVLAEVYHKLQLKKVNSAFEYLRTIMGAVKVYEFYQSDLFNALKSNLDINFNDKIHIAIMKRNNIKMIISFDKDFDKDKTIIRQEL
ncbi:type II toxin-antitoxin system VapC family toxin [Candidatus Woesearchaeota archaeon]|nr:type II toxin-antitoxin system VapC family toxin [Candidatus Woesearchaeota archaeon]